MHAPLDSNPELCGNGFFADDVFEPPAQQARLEQHLHALLSLLGLQPHARRHRSGTSCAKVGSAIAAGSQG